MEYEIMKKAMLLTLEQLRELVARYPADAKIVDIIEKETR